MGKAEDAFEEARRRIAEAKRTGATGLDLEIEGLERIPEEIAGLTGITALFLMHTQVKDLTPIAGLTGITALNLFDTQVSNLTPITGLTGIWLLDLSNTQVKDLTPIAGLTRIIRLFLSRTPVRDLTPIAVLTGITGLALEGTQVAELSVVAGFGRLEFIDLTETAVTKGQLRHLGGKPGLVPWEGTVMRTGVRLAGSAAAKEDARIAEIAEIEDARERTLALFDYLGFDELGEPKTPEPDDFLPVRIEGGKLEVSGVFPSTDEADERLKRLMHDRLREKAHACAAQAGNQFSRMAAKARTLQQLVERPFEELVLVSIHMEVEDLEAQAKLGAENGLNYEPELLSAVAEISRTGPGLTRDNEEVEKLVNRIVRTREQPADAAVDGPRAALSDAIINAPEAHGDVSIDLEKQARDATDPVMARAIRGPKQGNMLWRLATVAIATTGTMVTGVASSLVATAYGPAITGFVQSNWALLVEVAATYGAGFAAWFTAAVGEVAGSGHLPHLPTRKDAKAPEDESRGG